MTTSTWSCRLVNLSGSVALCFQATFGKYSSAVLPLILNLPEPARRNTRATDSLRRPVPRIQVCLPMRGEPVELNVPPKLKTKTVHEKSTKAIQRHLVRVSRKTPMENSWRLEYCRLLHPPEQQSPNPYSFNDYLPIPCGFCPPWRA